MRRQPCRYQALFTDAGGLAPGNDVLVSGIKVGTVSDVALQHGDALVTFTLARHGPARVGQLPRTSEPVRCWASGC